MKRSVPLILSLILLCGCQEEVPEKTIQMKSIEEIMTQLDTSGYEVKDTTAASFHIWENLNPASLILAENPEGQLLIMAEFDSAEKAEAAYKSLVPESDSSVINQNQEGYWQSVVPLPDNNGFWVFRKAGNDVIGGWVSSNEQTAAISSLFDTFEAGASVDQQDQVSIPTDNISAPAEQPTDQTTGNDTMEPADQTAESEAEQSADPSIETETVESIESGQPAAEEQPSVE